MDLATDKSITGCSRPDLYDCQTGEATRVLPETQNIMHETLKDFSCKQCARDHDHHVAQALAEIGIEAIAIAERSPSIRVWQDNVVITSAESLSLLSHDI